jgi:putative tryptophan/tyrosine transport system substrate-binding protein
LFGFLVNPTNPANAQASIKLMKEAADALGLELKVLNASKEDDFDVAFATLVTLHAGGMIIANDTFFLRHSARATRDGIAAPCYAGDFAITRIRRGRRFDELQRQLLRNS